MLGQLSILPAFLRFILLNSVLQCVLRGAEALLIFVHHGIQELYLSAEFLGLIYDLVSTNALLLLTYPLFYLLFKLSNKLANSLYLGLFSLGTIAHFAILRYFIHNLIPLDTFLYQYTLGEVILSINTSGLGVSFTSVLLISSLLFLCLFYHLLRQYTIHSNSIRQIFVIGGVGVLFFLAVMIQIGGYYQYDALTQNKSLFFYQRSFSYFFIPPPIETPYTTQDAKDFQKLYSTHKHRNLQYPLLHTFDSEDSLSTYFEPFDTDPNLVMVFVEGLNDDFIHSYHGAKVMPFLDSLQHNSLYWNRCFSLGERSFAVIPSVLGGLPYGEIGFTILDRLPRHHSLVSILNDNNYFTSFYISQSGWFHKNDKFFTFNDADIFLEKEMFAPKYPKIVVRVGQEDYFWGYNDKDLFNQAMDIKDSIATNQPQLDIYFTGTSHSPYVVSDPELYEQKFQQLIGGLDNQAEIDYFQNYKKIIITLLFTNDALRDLIQSYAARPNYENTVFLITGDHPMTEIPTKNLLKRFHVPLFIFSPKLKQSIISSNVVSHLDVFETMLAFCQSNNLKVPKYSTSLGDKLLNREKIPKKMAFMNDNREIVDYYSNGYYLSRKQLFKVGEDLSLHRAKNPELNQQLQKELAAFKKTSQHVSINNRIIPEDLFCQQANRSIVFSRKDTSKTTFATEFESFVEPMEIPNETHYFDAFFKYEGDIDAATSLVYEVRTKTDKIVFWKNAPFHDRKTDLQVHMKIPKQDVVDSTLIFKFYLWNRQKRKTTFFDTEVSLQRVITTQVERPEAFEIIFFVSDSSSLKFDSVYYNLIKPIKITNQEYYFEASFWYDGGVDEETFLVYELTTLEGKTILWKSSELKENGHYFQIREMIPQQNIGGKELVFKTYIWNQKQRKMKWMDLELEISR